MTKIKNSVKEEYRNPEPIHIRFQEFVDPGIYIGPFLLDKKHAAD
jgi:hypothetical protein